MDSKYVIADRRVRWLVKTLNQLGFMEEGVQLIMFGSILPRNFRLTIEQSPGAGAWIRTSVVVHLGEDAITSLRKEGS